MTADTTTVPRRKLIEVALPLEKINAESAREKSIRHGHPSTLHLWWSRKPLATARAVLFAQLVDDPSSHPDRFPTEEAVSKERERLHGIIEQLVLWENSHNEQLLRRAYQEIIDSSDGVPPRILDPFSGGGSIPLEAQRLGLEAHASDINPVATLINKALIEIPSIFLGNPPVFPGSAESQIHPWPNATGLAEDVRKYAHWIRGEAEKRIGHLYPKARLADGTEAPVIAWIWARTIDCPNPACGIRMPLSSKWWLGNKKGREAYVVPHVSNGKVEFSIGHDLSEAPSGKNEGTVDRNGALCVGCGAAVDFAYIRAQGRSGRIGTQLMATVAEGARTRIYVDPTPEQESAAKIQTPTDIPFGDIPEEAIGFRVRAYGVESFADLFSARQLTALTVLSDLVDEARKQIEEDAIAAGMRRGDRLEQGGTGAASYADAVATFLGLGVSKLADMANMMVSWKPSMDQAIHLFTRQAISMAWDFAETPPLANKHAGGYITTISGIAKAIDKLTPSVPGKASQESATDRPLDGYVISTDPPYYDYEVFSVS